MNYYLSKDENSVLRGYKTSNYSLHTKSSHKPDMKYDPAVPEIRTALSIKKMLIILSRHLPEHYRHIKPFTITRINLLHHQPGQYYHLQYHLNTVIGKLILTGKIYAQYRPKNSFNLSQHIYEQLLASTDNQLAIPEPVCIIPELKMFIERKVEGCEVSKPLIQNPPALAKKIALLAHTLHQTTRSVSRIQGYEDIRKTTQLLLANIKVHQSPLLPRMKVIIKKANELIDKLPKDQFKLIHGNFTINQLIFGNTQLYLLNTDQCIMGDPCFDMGTLLADIQVKSLREHGNTDALTSIEHSLIQEYLRLNPDYSCDTLQCYNIIALMKQMGTEVINANDSHVLEAITTECERKLGTA